MIGSAATPGLQPRRHPGGFTLIELLVVLAVIGLLMALVLPSFKQPPQARALAARAHELGAALRRARDRAVMEDRPIEFAADERTFGPRGGPSAHVPPGIALTLLDTRQAPSVRPISFYPDGSSSGGGVALEAGNARYLVLVNWIDGDVAVRPAPWQPRP